MNKDLQTLVSVYMRYINSLKAESADIKTNYASMRDYINEHSPIWIKGHMLQDCYINCLRAFHNKPLEVSSIIKELSDSKCSTEKLSKAEAQLTITKKDDNGEYKEYRESWLPSLYKYFTPMNDEELIYMFVELDKMNEKKLISTEDYDLVHWCLNGFAKTRDYPKDNTKTESTLFKSVLDDDEEELELAEA